MKRAPYFFLLPYFAIFGIFWAGPILYSMYLSMVNTRAYPWVVSPSANWGRMIHDPVFWTALGNTLLMLGVQVPLMLVLSIGMAVALNSPRLRGKPLFRFAFFAPVVVGAVAYSAVFRLLFNTRFGAVNAVGGALGLPAIDWLYNPWAAVLVLVGALTWRWTGYNAIILLSGLQSIPRELYEAAQVDGADDWRQFVAITLPSLRNVIVFCAVLSIIGTLQLFTEPLLITGGGPGNATLTLGVYLYRQGFRTFNFGYASAVAYSMAVLAAIFALAQARLFKSE